MKESAHSALLSSDKFKMYVCGKTTARKREKKDLYTDLFGGFGIRYFLIITWDELMKNVEVFHGLVVCSVFSLQLFGSH